MNFRKLSLIGALFSGMIVHSTAQGQDLNWDLSHLPYLMRNEGIRKEIRLKERTDLAPLWEDALQRTRAKDPSCEVQLLSEVRLVRQEVESIVGYEAYVECLDSPSPAIALYYDVKPRYLKAFSLAH